MSFTTKLHAAVLADRGEHQLLRRLKPTELKVKVAIVFGTATTGVELVVAFSIIGLGLEAAFDTAADH